MTNITTLNLQTINQSDDSLLPTQKKALSADMINSRKLTLDRFHAL